MCSTVSSTDVLISFFINVCLLNSVLFYVQSKLMQNKKLGNVSQTIQLHSSLESSEDLGK